MVLEKTLESPLDCRVESPLDCRVESPLDCKEIQPVYSKGDQSWVFIGRTNAKGETPLLWPRHEELTHWKEPLGGIGGRRRG